MLSRGLSKEVVDDLLPFVSPEGEDGFFWDAAKIMDPDRGLYWPGQKRFLVVGSCPNGDGVAIDTENEKGAVFYVAHELLGCDYALEEMVIRVADSPSDWIEKVSEDDFPYDHWEASTARTEPSASPNGGPGVPIDRSAAMDGRHRRAKRSAETQKREPER